MYDYKIYVAKTQNSFDAVALFVEMSGGSLSDAIVKKEVQGELFAEPQLKDLLLQVSMGLKYIHSSGLVHLDIKPSMPYREAFTLSLFCSV